MTATITILTNDAGYLTKVFSRNDDGSIKKVPAANLSKGRFEVMNVAGLAELDAALNNLKASQVVTYGRPATSRGEVVAEDLLSHAPGAISRTRANWAFPNGPGILMLDYDPAEGRPTLSPEEWRQTLVAACPFLTNVGCLWRPSASSGINDVGLRGQRLYLMLDDASQIPRVGKAIFDRLWLDGSGFYVISKSGQLLERSLVDASVWKPEGLDFAAKPVLNDDIKRTVFPSKLHAGEILQTATVSDLLAYEKIKLEGLKQEARAKVRPETEEVKAKFASEKKPVIAKNLIARGLPVDDDLIALTVDRAVNHAVLLGDWPLRTPTGETITVGEVLDNPTKWHGTRWADPLEPDVDNRVGWINLRSGRQPYLYSHLHGGTRYTLECKQELIFVEAGQLPRMVDTLSEVIKKSGGIYTRAGGLAYVDEESRIVKVTPAWLNVYAERVCRFERFDIRKNKNVPASCPDKVASGVLAQAARHALPTLAAVRTAPTMDSTGRLIVDQGYDEPTSLLLVNDSPEAWPQVNPSPSAEELRDAMAILWKPFASFPYAEPMDASVCLAAVLTAAVRACIPTSPGFGFSATAPGTGKTLLAQCIGMLYDGVVPAASAPIVHEEEWIKTLFSAALGGSGAILFDNAEHAIESASLCVATTSSALKSRVLGESRDAEAEHRLLIMVTGNGLRLVGDLNRRFFVCRLDAKMEASDVSGRQFDLEPLGYCKANRTQIISAALTLIRGYIAARSPRVCDGLASMDDWNKLVRSTIIWLVQQGSAPGFVDPKEALKRDGQNDPAALKLAGFLAGVQENIGLGNRFTVAQLVEGAATMFGNLDTSERVTIDLAPILDDIAGDRGAVNKKRLGHWLVAHAGRIVNGLRLIRDGEASSKVACWKVCSQ